MDSEGNAVIGMKVTASQVQPVKGHEQFEDVTKSDGTFRITGLLPSSPYMLRTLGDTWTAETTVRIQSPPKGETANLTEPVLIVPKFCEPLYLDSDGRHHLDRMPDLVYVDHGDGTVTLAPSNPDSIYIDHRDGTVTDLRTGLMWKACAEGLNGATCENGSAEHLTWIDALEKANASNFANYTDWRLPSVDELRGLIEQCRGSPTINTHRFPNTADSVFWSVSPFPGVAEVAWAVNFGSGEDHGRHRDAPLAVRLVRGGP